MECLKYISQSMMHCCYIDLMSVFHNDPILIWGGVASTQILLQFVSSFMVLKVDKYVHVRDAYKVLANIIPNWEAVLNYYGNTAEL